MFQVGPSLGATLSMLLLLFAIPFVGMLVWLYRAVIAESRKAADNLRGLGRRLDLTYEGKGIPRLTAQPSVGGMIAGREVRFYSFTTRSGKSSTDWRAAAVYLRKAGGLTFDLHRQGLGSKLEAMFGAREAVVGDPEFDAMWFLKTNQPKFLSAALVLAVREKMMLTRGQGSGGANFKLEQNLLRYAERGSFADAEASLRLQHMLPLLNDLADIAETAADQDL